MWCRWLLPVRGSSEIREEGKTYCQAHSRAAFGNFRFRAKGRCTLPKSIFEILLVLRFHPKQMPAQRFGQVQRKHRDAIFAAFGVAHRDLAESKINIFYPQSDAFHQTQATPIKKSSH